MLAKAQDFAFSSQKIKKVLRFNMYDVDTIHLNNKHLH